MTWIITFNGHHAPPRQLFDDPRDAEKEMQRVANVLTRNNANTVAREYDPGIPAPGGLLFDKFTFYALAGGANVYRIVASET